jgi:hypothetical protein
MAGAIQSIPVYLRASIGPPLESLGRDLDALIHDLESRITIMEIQILEGGNHAKADQ